MLEELIGERAELVREGEEMIIVLIFGPWYAEEGLPGDKFEDKAAEAPDVKGSSNVPSKN